MKWQIVVLLCCGWMGGVALGDTENPQKAEPDGTAVINQGQGDVMVYSISEEAFAKKAVDLGVTDAALANFFKILEQEKVAPADLDEKLYETAKSYKKLLESSDDPEVNTLLRQARESIEGKDAQGNSVTIDFAKAEALLQQAMLREQQHIRELQQIEEQAEAALKTKSESMTRIPPQLGDLVDTQFYELHQIEEQTKAARKRKQMSVVLILVQLGNLADTQLKYDKANSYYEQAYGDQRASNRWETVGLAPSSVLLSLPYSMPYSMPESFFAPMNPCYGKTPGMCDLVSGCGCTQ